jgi:hypothetical protein
MVLGLRKINRSKNEEIYFIFMFLAYLISNLTTQFFNLLNLKSNGFLHGSGKHYFSFLNSAFYDF